MEDRKKLWVELAAGREDQGVLTKYPLPTKFNQFVEMKMRFRYGAPGGESGSRPMELQTIDEAGGIIADYFTYDRLWIDTDSAEVSEKSCRVIPHFDSWRPDRRDLWRRGLTLLGRFVTGADAIILLLSPALPSLRRPGAADQPRPRRLPLHPLAQPAARHRDLEGGQAEGVLHRDRAVGAGTHVPQHVRHGRLPPPAGRRRDGDDPGRPGRPGISTKEDVFLVSSAVSTGGGHPLLVGDSGQEAPTVGSPTMGVPVMVNTTLPLARACERVLERRATKGA